MHDGIDLYALLSFDTHERYPNNAPYFPEIIMVSYNKKDLERCIDYFIEEDPEMFDRINYKIIRIDLGKTIDYGYDEFLEEQEQKQNKIIN